jgi:hypothetical protein
MGQESFEEFNNRHPSMAEEILESISCARNTERVGITSVERHNAIDKTVCGYANTPEGRFAFEAEDGISRGTVVLQWVRPEDFVQREGEEFRGFMLVPNDERILHADSPQARETLMQYRRLIEQPWFKSLVRGYNQDMYNDPAGNRTRKHWQGVLRKHGLRAVPYKQSLRWTGKE